MDDSGDRYTLAEASARIGIPVQTLKLRMTAITKSTGKQWRKVGRDYYFNAEELAALEIAVRGEHLHLKPAPDPRFVTSDINQHARGMPGITPDSPRG